ncbi:MAG: ureidoglycolate lyase [Planktomarina sp.]
MSNMIDIRPMDVAAFASFGDILEVAGDPDKIINQGMCGRYHDRAQIDFAGGKTGISLFKAQPRALPVKLDMMERHPVGSQAFVPMSMDSFLVIVAADNNGKPGHPIAFETQAGQAINFHRNTWHGVLTPLSAPGLFAVVDRIGDDPNLEEHWFDTPYVVDRNNAGDETPAA